MISIQSRFIWNQHRAPLKRLQRTNGTPKVSSIGFGKQMPLRSYLVAINIEGRKWKND